MKKTINSNIFRETADELLQLYGDAIDGTGDEAVLVLSQEVPGPVAKAALGGSLKALGYGEPSESCEYVACDGLGALDIRTVIEGLDPLVVISCDQASAVLLSQAYKQPIPLDAMAYVLGRPVIAFQDFQAMLADEAGKQRAWAALKRLPRGKAGR